MIRITVDLVPYGLEEAKRTIAQMRIVNDGTGTPERGNYKYSIITDGEEYEREGVYLDYKRRLGIEELVRQILNKEYHK